MLSIYTLQSAREASKYYARGDYYTANSPEQSFWWGEGAKRLGLEAMVDPEVFEQLLRGRLPNGVVMSQTHSGQTHRPGYDLTFSAPKSVSILALIAGNEGVLRAHREAIKETLTYIEAHYAAVRNKKQKVTTIEKTANALFAVFEEYDSRAGDPQLHHHCVLMNMSQKANDCWRAFYCDEVYRDKIVTGLEYRGRLAQKLMALGYVLAFRPGGLFEIVGVPESLIEQLSKRRREIKSYLEEHQLEGGKAAKVANFETRDDKKPEALQIRQERWRQALKDIDVSLETLTHIEVEAKARGPVALPDPRVFAEQALRLAIAHCSEKYPHFFIKTLIKQARRFCLFPLSSADCLAVIEARTKDTANKTLVYVGEGILKSTAAIEQEQTLLASIQSSHRLQPILSAWVADFVLKWKVGHKIEQGALKFLLTSTQAQVLLEAHSKILLRDTFKQFNRLCEAQQVYPCFLSNRASEIDSLKHNLQSKRVFSIEGFLLSVESRLATQNPNPSRLEQWTARIQARQARAVWVVVSRLSLSQWTRLQEAAQAHHARLILSQNSPHDALMQPFKEAGLPCYEVKVPNTTVQGLKTQEALLQRLERLTRVGGIIEVAESTARMAKAAQWSVSFNKPIITLSHAERVQVCEAVRRHLVDDHTLGTSKTFFILEPLSLSQAQKNSLGSYQPGDVIRFPVHQPGRHYGGQYEVVQSVDLKSGVVHFQSETQWLPAHSNIPLKRIEVFKSVSRSLCVNEVIQWTRTVRHEKDKSLDRVATQKAIVAAIDDQTQEISVRLQNGKVISINGAVLANSHWDYGYANLLKQADLERPKGSVVLLNSQSIDATSIEQLDQLLTQGKALKAAMHLICNDLAALKEAIIDRGIPQDLNRKSAEIPYHRHEALAQDQSISTQILFAGLQAEYLKVRELNPEFLPKNLSKEPEPTSGIDPNLNTAARILDQLCLYHAERDAVFSATQITKEAIQCAGATLSSKQFNQAFEVASQKGWLIMVGYNEMAEPLFACRHTVLLEKLCIEHMKQGQGQLQPLLSTDSEGIQQLRNHPTLRQGQKEAIELLLTTADRVCAVQGIAGAGKTTALKELHALCQAAGIEALVLANTGNAKNRAQEASGIMAMTVAQFLTRLETALSRDPFGAQKDYGHYKLLIVDEASMPSTQDIFRLQKVTIALNAHLSFMGDFKQQGSLGAGLAFEDLLAFGVAKVVMKENVRLKSAKAFGALQKAYAGDMPGTLQVLKDQIEEIPVKAEALQRMVELYVGCIEKNQAPPLVITPLNKDRFRVNQGIREGLQQKGYLSADVLQTTLLLPKDMREIQKQDVRSFGLAEVIRFNTHDPRLGIAGGSYWAVQAIDATHHRLTLQPFMKNTANPEQSIYWSPKDLQKTSQIEVYVQRTAQFAKNDLILFRRNQPEAGIANGDRAHIIGMRGSQLSVRLYNQSVLSLDVSDPSGRHFDYGYALTVYQSQGRDVPHVIAYGDGPKPLKRLGRHLKMGDLITLPKDIEAPAKYSEKPLSLSTLVRIIGIQGDELMLVDGKGNRYHRSLRSNPSWDYFPACRDRPEWAWPKTTSQKAFLVQISRGDFVHLIVPNLQDFQALLEARANPKGSALSYIDSGWETLNRTVQRLVSAIQWKHAQADLHTEQILQNKTGFKNETVLEQRSRRSTSIRVKNTLIDKEAMIDHLSRDPLHYASQWLGPPKKVMGSDARWSGGLTVTIKGSHAGRWRHWVGDEGGGDLISLYARAYNVEWKTALKALARDLGFESSTEGREGPKRAAIQGKTEHETAALKNDKSHQAQKLYAQAVPIQGTLAEKYLRKARGIEAKLPSDFRFVKATRHFETGEYRSALIAPIWDEDHQLKALTRIFLNPDGSQYQAVYEDERGQTQKANPKLSLGSLGHSGVVVQEGVDPRTLWLAEGVETALSVAQAKPMQTVIASLSVNRFKNIAVQSGVEQVVICADHDGVDANSYKSVGAAVEHYLKQGLQVFIAMPAGIEGQKRDFNDVLKQGGIAEVHKNLDQKIEIKNITTCRQEVERLAERLQAIQLQDRGILTISRKIDQELEH